MKGRDFSFYAAQWSLSSSVGVAFPEVGSPLAGPTCAVFSWSRRRAHPVQGLERWASLGGRARVETVPRGYPGLRSQDEMCDLGAPCPVLFLPRIQTPSVAWTVSSVLNQLQV